MAKRSVTELESKIQNSKQLKKFTSGSIREPSESEEMGEFEDAWEDEIESDEDVNGEIGQDHDGMDIDEILPAIEEFKEPSDPEAFIPGRYKLEKDETLEPDDSVYIMRHSMDVNWPCLSFDVLRDSFGNERKKYPAMIYLVSGSQADIPKNNEISVHKLSSLHRTQSDEDPVSIDGDDSTDDQLDDDPIVESRSIPHHGGVNRIRAQPLPVSSSVPPVSQPYYVASWAETGKVHIFDVRSLIESLDVPGYVFDKSVVNIPIFTVDSHCRAEGFALDWASSGSASLRLVTGDIHSKIFLTTTSPSGFKSHSQPFLTHTSSIEDLQWSPSEPTVFASCSADSSIQIWDVRSKSRSITSISSAHDSDVNVISWNKITSYLLISGGDEGGIKVWDLRTVKKKRNISPDSAPVAAFTWHKEPVTSIEWHPTEDSIFAASGADDQVTLWDLAVEQDDEETRLQKSGVQDVPSQLLFVHQGQKDVKEIHWHPQLPGTVVSTALDGLNIFKTISV